MTRVAERPKPFVVPEYCKGCGRCITSCTKACITMGTEINPETGLIPIILDLSQCNGCGLCFDACPEPYGLRPQGEEAAFELLDPSTVLPELDGVFIQAVSEVATVNMMYGAGGAGKRCMTFTSSPGFSLMLEGISYMIGAEVPAVFVNVMRGGPGLGNIGPEQADIKLVCRGLGHGNTHAIVLAPATPQEMLDIAMLSFELAFKYRNPVVVVGDGYLGQMTGKVRLPRRMVEPGIPEWAVFGDHSHRGNLICSLNLSELGLEQHNVHLNEKYERMTAEEQRADLYRCDDAEILLVACNTPAQLAKGAIKELRDKGLKVGLFRPITLWPFPIEALRTLLDRVKRLVVVEASSGQLEDELRLALSHADVLPPPLSHVRRMGGILPSQDEIIEHVLGLEEVR